MIAQALPKPAQVLFEPGTFKDELLLNLDELNLGKDLKVKIYDIEGDLIVSKIFNNTDTIRIGKELKPGAYLIQLINAEINQTVRVVKK
ncbi:MAG: T9SS type A sorting domain-containing protein [Cytophagaceae bacterium]|nr:T9SS type A sorting domain-containing protein [Cytophagaceae bacterium]